MSSYSLTQAPEAPYMHPFPNYPYILLRRTSSAPTQAVSSTRLHQPNHHLDHWIALLHFPIIIGRCLLRSDQSLAHPHFAHSHQNTLPVLIGRASFCLQPFCVHPATAKTKPRSTIHPAKHTNTHQPLGRG